MIPSLLSLGLGCLLSGLTNSTLLDLRFLNKILDRNACLGLKKGFSVRVPAADEVASPHPEGYVTFYYHQFTSGLCFHIHHFFLDINRRYGVPVNQLNPNAIKCIVCFVVVCVSVEIEPVSELFTQFFSIKLGPEAFYVTARTKIFLIGGITSKVKHWKSNFFYVKSDFPWGYDSTILTDTPNTAPHSSNFEESMRILQESISPDHYHIEQMSKSEDLLSRVGLLPFLIEGETNWVI